MSEHEEENRKAGSHSPKRAMMLSIVPGLGQFYNRRYFKGILFFILIAAFLVVFGNFLNIGYWGLVTLGTMEGVDDSRMLLIQGIVSVILTVFALGVYWLNLIDAKKDAERIKEGWKVTTLREGFKNAWDKGFPYALVAPGFFMIIFVLILPLMFMVALAFTNYNIYNSPPKFLLSWVGVKNFFNVFSVPMWRNTFFSVLSWTIIWTLVATTLQVGLALFLAIIVNDKRIKFKKFIRTFLILPWAIPGFVSILTFAAMFNDQFGAVNNQLLAPLGINIPWLTDPLWTKVAIIFVEVWLGFAYVFALFTGVLQSVSSDWYEAAEVDGASKWQKFRNITLPHVLFASAPLLIMQYTGNFNNFNLIYLFNQGGPPVRGQTAGSTDIVISWVYKLTFDTLNYNMAAVISIILGVFVASIAFFQFRRTRSFKEGGTNG
ncbi:carbohydrate ABC transporter membrane protein 1 (CUT1 family) [Fontibacillus phaseoli]|uniref:Maltose/maltodextrin transport system permease protein n=1 Tax=Fontibacillus phaseoli TaxID=1416533 RepID=A0A369BSY8_9BACL|nr:sugar ABC transporter permease [Fontibacillus phaseoli]RCX22724.1 carbohydrate ABC transporter membrane protein 1 (CUT1 family) [Fontibacillus phaseoli]